MKQQASAMAADKGAEQFHHPTKRGRVPLQWLMKQETPVGSKPKWRPYDSDPGEISPAPENLVNRAFQVPAPNKKCLTDITEFQIPAGKVDHLPIIGCFDGLVIR